MVTGMIGDGVNDAPALKQAEVGIAVANATDVAKAAASLVLTNPGLMDIFAAVKTSRRIYQRMLTYTLNKIVKTIEIAFLLSAGVVLTRSLIITPLLIVLHLFTNDFVTMSMQRTLCLTRSCLTAGKSVHSSSSAGGWGVCSWCFRSVSLWPAVSGYSSRWSSCKRWYLSCWCLPGRALSIWFVSANISGIQTLASGCFSARPLTSCS